MAIPNGIYTLRASPVVGIGGLYATGEGFDEPVRVAPQIPPFIERQIWKIEAVESKEGIYTIVRHTNEGTSEESWSPLEPPFPDSPIIVTEKVVEWRIAELDNGVSNAIAIQLVNAPIGAGWYVGTNEELQAVLKVLPIGVPVEAIPYWQLKAHED